MSELFSRNEMYWGETFQKYLKGVNIAIFGLGGVGGYAFEAFARAGVCNFTIIDFDKISKSNINRQIIAFHSNVGHAKTAEFKSRALDINPEIKLRIFDDFYDERLNSAIFSDKFDFVIDAIDTLKPKVELICFCVKNAVPLISSMGAGNRLDGSKMFTDDVQNIKPNCQFVKNIFAKLKKEGVLHDFTVVTSYEKPHNLSRVENIEKITRKDGETVEFRKFSPASIVTPVAISGYLMANFVILKLYENFYNKS